MNSEVDPKPADSGAPQVAEHGQFSRLVLEIGPLVVFFFTNWKYGIFTATGVFMVVTVIALTVSRVKFGRIPVMPLVSGVFILVFGGLTLYFENEYFIKIKPTIVNLLFGTILFVGLAAGHSLLRILFGEVFKLQDRGWRILTFRWALFFCLLAVLNEIVWRNFSTEFWISFKMVGIMPITMIFAISQVALIQKYDASEQSETDAASSD